MSRIKVLYVDDEPDLREIAEMSLELDPNLEVRCCASGREAVQLAANWHPDLVLLDVMMPELDGPATFKILVEEHGDAFPIVFITARAGASEAQHLKELGAAGVIAKPFDPLQLADEVRSFLREG